MSYSTEFSHPNYEQDEEDKDEEIKIPTIKLRIKLNAYSDKKKKKKHNKKSKHPAMGGKRPFVLLQQDNTDEQANKQQPKSKKVVAPAEKPKKRGRPTNKAKAAALAAAMAKIQDAHKRDPKSLFLKLLDSIQKKDEYGFFLEPVNPEYVPDYLKIIKSPMDFSTMRNKIERNEYKDTAGFRHDFKLIVNNAKLYNARDTIYWKSADKVHEAGLKLIDRSEKQIQEEIIHAIKEEDAVVAAAAVVDTPYKKKKKIPAAVVETNVVYGPDGSLDSVSGGVHDIETFIPMEHPFCDPPQITTANPAALPSGFYSGTNREEYQHYYRHFTHSAHFCDYGPFSTLGGQPPGAFYTAVDAAYIYPVLGDDRGEAYIKSLWEFIDHDDDDELREYVEKKSNHLTTGAWRVMKQTLNRRNEHILSQQQVV